MQHEKVKTYFSKLTLWFSKKRTMYDVVSSKNFDNSKIKLQLLLSPSLIEIDELVEKSSTNIKESTTSSICFWKRPFSKLLRFFVKCHFYMSIVNTAFSLPCPLVLMLLLLFVRKKGLWWKNHAPLEDIYPFRFLLHSTLWK